MIESEWACAQLNARRSKSLAHKVYQISHSDTLFATVRLQGHSGNIQSIASSKKISRSQKPFHKASATHAKEGLRTQQTTWKSLAAHKPSDAHAPEYGAAASAGLECADLPSRCCRAGRRAWEARGDAIGPASDADLAHPCPVAAWFACTSRCAHAPSPRSSTWARSPPCAAESRAWKA